MEETALRGKGQRGTHIAQDFGKLMNRAGKSRNGTGGLQVDLSRRTLE